MCLLGRSNPLKYVFCPVFLTLFSYFTDMNTGRWWEWCDPTHGTNPWGAGPLCRHACPWVESLGFSFLPILWDHPADPSHPVLQCLPKKPRSPSSWAWCHKIKRSYFCNLCGHLPNIQRMTENRDREDIEEVSGPSSRLQGRMNHNEIILPPSLFFKLALVPRSL